MVTLTRGVVEKYRELSKRLADPSMLSKLRSLFKRQYTIKELLEWLHEKVKWSKGNIKRHSDPVEIIAYGKGDAESSAFCVRLSA